MRLPCGGLHHQTQCRNVTKAVEPGYDVVFAAPNTVEPPWRAAESGGQQGDRWLPVEDICDNHAEIKRAADCGVVSLIFVGAAVLAMTVAGFLPEVHNVKLLGAALVLIALAWILLLSALVSFEGILNSDAVCIVSHVSDTGAVYAHGKFKDITRASDKKGGMLGFRFMCPAIAFLSVALLLVFHRVMDLLMPGKSNKEPSSPKSVPQAAQKEQQEVS